MAPHRVTTTLRLPCPAGRPMRGNVNARDTGHDLKRFAGTREIGEAVVRAIRTLLRKSSNVLKTPNEAFGIRLTAMPVGDEIGFERVFRRQGLVEGLEETLAQSVTASSTAKRSNAS